MTKVTRRGFIEGGVKTAAVATAATAVTPLIDPFTKTKTWAWNSGRETFHFIGFTHGFFNDPRFRTPDPEKEFGEDVDGIFTEDIDDYLNPKKDQAHQAIAEGYGDDMPGFGLTYKYCREKNVSLFLGDLSFKPEGELALKAISVAIPGAEVVGGSVLAVKSVSRKTWGRKRFLLSVLGLGLAALGASSPTVRLLKHEGGNQTRRDIEATLSDRIHPENIMIVGRNALWAKKLFFLGEELRQRGIKHPEIGIVAGFGHRYLDYYLRHPNEIDGVLSMHKGLMENTVVSKEYLYKILELRLREGSFTKQILRVPELERTYLEKEGVSLEAKG